VSIIISKFPHYQEEATEAFQKVSLAYETLSKPVSRRAYDLTGGRNGFGGVDSDGLNAGEYFLLLHADPLHNVESTRDG
jgi:DnaJ-class molecular chaperone